VKPEPLVSIIIVNWNGGKILSSCLRSLKKMTYRNWELILVDNGSADGSEKFANELIKDKKVVLIRNKKNEGFASANNQGVKNSHGKYILLLNNDTEVSRNFLTILVNKMEKNKSIGVLQPKILLLDKKGYLDNTGSFFTWIGFLQHQGYLEKDNGQYDRESDVFSVKGACMLVRAEVVNKIGLFDDDFFSYFEESDFCWRVWLVEKKVVYFPAAFVYHKVGYTIRRLNVRDINFHYYKNRICSLIKNLELKNLVIVLPLHLVASFIISGAFLLRGNFQNFLMILNSIIWNISNLDKTLEKREKIQKYRKLSDNFLFNNLTANIDWLKYWRDFKRIEADIKG